MNRDDFVILSLRPSAVSIFGQGERSALETRCEARVLIRPDAIGHAVKKSYEEMAQSGHAGASRPLRNGASCGPMPQDRRRPEEVVPAAGIEPATP
jgi:hypothetical protein